jgi:hypothetical protein
VHGFWLVVVHVSVFHVPEVCFHCHESVTLCGPVVASVAPEASCHQVSPVTGKLGGVSGY